MAEQLTIKDVEKVFDDKLKPIVKHFNERMDKSDERMDKMDERFDKIDERFDKLENRIVKVEILIENDIS
ncbi:MAG: hypothetical protein FWH01_10705, partial [Oscillospiraceae bacterium]|nr:hypothetical protein [Oscillospiraceae bacterium]